MAKNQNTVEKRRREMEKKRKAEEKLQRRMQRKLAVNEPAAPLTDEPTEEVES